jgi:hypothetical protein
MEDIARELMQQYLGYVRAMQLWFHGAHHSARGTSFAGDHGILYTKIYQGFQDHFDDVFITVILGTLAGIPMEEEDVHFKIILRCLALC